MVAVDGVAVALCDGADGESDDEAVDGMGGIEVIDGAGPSPSDSEEADSTATGSAAW